MSRETSMSEAEKFRKSTKEFWWKMDQKGERVAARRGARVAPPMPVVFQRTNSAFGRYH